jgi:hypothetical protein
MAPTFMFMITAHNAAPWLDKLVGSLASQTWSEWHAVIVDDASTDETASRLKRLLTQHNLEQRFAVRGNDVRKYKARNVYETLQNHGKAEDIVVMLDGDDWLACADALDVLVPHYVDGWEVIWSNWVGSEGSKGRSGHLNPFVSPRRQPWVSSHLFTFRKRLFEQVTPADLQDDAGSWFRAGCDVAIALPLLEQTIRRKYLDQVLCVYNRDNALSHDHRAGGGTLTSPEQMRTTRQLMQRPATIPAEDNAFLHEHLYDFLSAAFHSGDRANRLRLERAFKTLLSQAEAHTPQERRVPPWRRPVQDGGGA